MSTTDETLLKKRSTQHLHATELIENKASKRKKVSHLDNLNLFLNFLSDLNEDQKLIVRNLEFGSLLDISCNCSVDDIFEWLGIQFNTTTSSIELRNGFKFKFTDSVVQKILGIPCGGLPIHTNPSKETVDFISTVVQSSNPTIEHLLSMISENITEEAFSRIFLLLALSTLVAPNSKGVPSKKFYSALVNLDSVPKYNWCLFALSFLIHQINKTQSDIRNNRTVFPGGCKLILVITHFKFLISSEYKIPTNSFPRLPLWSSTMLKSFIALDTMPGVNLQFGRLVMKHISSTPFSDASNELTVQLPESILHYINSKFPSIHNIQEKTKLESSSQKFCVGSASTKDLPCLEVFNRDPINKIDSYIETSPLQVLFDSMKSEPTWKELHATDHLNWRQEKFSFTQCRFISASSSFRGNRLYCAPDEAEIQPPGFKSMLLSTHSCQQTTLKSHQTLLTGTFPSIQGTDQKTAPSSSIPSKLEDDIPSFNAITDGVQDAPAHRMTAYQTTTYSVPGSSTLVVNSGSQSYPRFPNHNSPFLYSNSPLRPFNNNSGQPENRFGTPISDPLLELLMRPLLDHSDPICRDILSEARVGFSLQKANFVHLPCFNDKQWIVITANLQTGRFFDIMNPDGSGNDKFTTIISTVAFNFKTLFAMTYPNCTAFNIRDFDCRFVPVPRTHFRYDTGVFLLQILKTYRGMGVVGFSTVDLQAPREIFLYEIATYSNSEVQLPIVRTFLESHGFRSFK